MRVPGEEPWRPVREARQALEAEVVFVLTSMMQSEVENGTGQANFAGLFAEIKKSRIGAGTQQHHFSYIGDAEVGEQVNIGAGAVTANFDGERKNRTVIGRGAFIGVDTMLRAPVTIGEGARTGAGSVVTRDVPPGVTVVGMPARPMDIRRRRGTEPPAPGTDPVSAGAERNPQTGGTSSTPDA